jgi:hypothetical protein
VWCCWEAQQLHLTQAGGDKRSRCTILELLCSSCAVPAVLYIGRPKCTVSACACLLHAYGWIGLAHMMLLLLLQYAASKLSDKGSIA